MTEQKDFTDLIIHLTECINEYENKSVYNLINWRVLKKYCDDFLTDNHLELKIIDKDKAKKR
jgi:hypothetical protein